MKERLARIVADLAADYADIRYEENKKTRVAYRGERLELVSSYATSGGHVRVYADGGKATASFSDPVRVGSIADASLASARLAAKGRDRPLQLADAPVVTGEFPVSPRVDPRTVKLEEKIELLRHYNDLILREPDVLTSEAEYDEFGSPASMQGE